MTPLQICYRSPAALKPSARNARTHSRAQIKDIARSIEEFGFTNPILIGNDGAVLAGHGRLAAAQLLKLETVPTVTLVSLTPEQRRAYILADNKLAERAGWDKDLLRLGFEELLSVAPELDLTLTGFLMPEIDLILAGEGNAHDDDPEIPALTPQAVIRKSEIWALGEHRLLCGDARDAEALSALMANERAQMVFIDPPYNVRVQGHVRARRSGHAEFVMASGEMSSSDFTAFLEQSLRALAAQVQPGASLFVCMDWRHMPELSNAAAHAGLQPVNLCIWVKTNGGMGSLYRSRHELIGVYRHGDGASINNVELGRHGRYRSNVWTYPGVNSFGRKRQQDLDDHPTIKPVAMVADAILDCSHRGGIVLDSFIGSGTTILAAERTGRRGYGVEIDPRYADVTIRRWQAATGKAAKLLNTGETWNDRRAALLEAGHDA